MADDIKPGERIPLSDTAGMAEPARALLAASDAMSIRVRPGAPEAGESLVYAMQQLIIETTNGGLTDGEIALALSNLVGNFAAETMNPMGALEFIMQKSLEACEISRAANPTPRPRSSH